MSNKLKLSLVFFLAGVLMFSIGLVRDNLKGASLPTPINEECLDSMDKPFEVYEHRSKNGGYIIVFVNKSNGNLFAVRTSKN